LRTNKSVYQRNRGGRSHEKVNIEYGYHIKILI
jgi:hypothetical protein